MANRPGGEDPTAGPDPILIEVGKRLRELRAAAGLSQRKFAEASGLSPAYVYTLEAGGPNLSVVVLSKMAKVLGVPITAFFEQTDPEQLADPVLSKIASELFRIRTAMDSRRDAITSILGDLEGRLKKSRDAAPANKVGASTEGSDAAAPRKRGPRKEGLARLSK